MPSAALRYDFGYEEQARPQRSTRPDLQVVNGRARKVETKGASPIFLTSVKILVVAFVVLAIVGVARVAISTATVSVLVSSESIQTQIDQAREDGNGLEIDQAVLSNPTRIKSAAAALGMGTATSTEHIDMASGVLATDSNGNLSLSGTLDALQTACNGNV